MIAANSPQANGRVERKHGVDQDRLVKALRLETYLPKMNQKFSRPAQSDEDAQVKAGKVKLDDILCRNSTGA